MQRLLQFLYKYRNLILFLILEGICAWIIVRNNNYQGSKFFNSSNRMAASLVATTDNIKDYFLLKEKNVRLEEENARLRQSLLELVDSIELVSLSTDTSRLGIKAKVIDNSLFFRNNYLIINKGSLDGVRKGMGVLGPDGVVGQVQHTSGSYSTVISLLHGKSLISAKHGPSGTLCTVAWDGNDHLTADVRYVPRHIEIANGDSIWTSGYNSVYPEQSLIGTVSQIEIGPDATFYDVRLDLSTDFGSLAFVYLLDIKDRDELDSLRTLNQLNDE